MAQIDNVFLTYASDVNPDGAGAQLHRIYGIYCLSRMLGTKYLHTPLHDVYYQGLDSLQNQQKDPAFVDTFNRTFALPSDRTTTASPACVTLPSPPVGALERALRVRYGGRHKQLLPIRLSKFGRLVAAWSKTNSRDHCSARHAACADGSLSPGVRHLQGAFAVQQSPAGRRASDCAPCTPRRADVR